jgi:hypothetical protein
MVGAFSSAFSSAFDIAQDDSPGNSPAGFIPCGDACWPEPYICDDCCNLDFDALDPSLRMMAAQWAANFLYTATGRQYGGCPRTYRPCRENCAPGPNCCGGYAGTGVARPYKLVNSLDWVNISCGVCRGKCGCSEVSEVYLPGVSQVLNVRLDGVDYDPCGMVAVYDDARIVRIDGGRWPVCQELGRLDGPGTWSITVLEGKCPPAGVELITGTLMCEFLKACLQKNDCRLPRRIQTLTRQGVTIGFNDRFENLADMRTGIWEIDAWIEQARYAGAATPSIVSPELVQQTELTWPRPGVDCTGSL